MTKFERGDVVIYQNLEDPDHNSVGSLGVVESIEADEADGTHIRINWMLPIGRITTKSLLDAPYHPNRLSKVGHINV